MFLNKNIIAPLALFLIIGFAIGYAYGLRRVITSGQIIVNNTGVISNAFKTKVIKTDITAKEACEIALADSRFWPEDAHLAGIELISKKFNDKGLSDGWKAMFYAKSKNKTFEVTIRDGESRGTIEKEAAAPLQTLKGEMIDSSALAKSFFVAYPVETEIISLRMYYDAGSKKFLWTVFFPKGSHTIDAEM